MTSFMQLLLILLAIFSGLFGLLLVAIVCLLAYCFVKACDQYYKNDKNDDSMEE